MIRGCLQNAFGAVGCAVLLLGGVVLVREFPGVVAAVFETPADTAKARASEQGAVGRPSPRALQSARRKHAQMARAGGPDYVVLSADEMASLIQEGLDDLGRRALDSLAVRFEADRFVLSAVLRTDVWGRAALGPFAAALEAREPIRVAGPARMDRAGVVAWEPDEFAIRGLPFPRVAVPSVVNMLTGGEGGAIYLAVPPTVGDLRIRRGDVTFYRRAP